jgi:putative membrane protein
MMKELILSWLVLALSVWVATAVVSGVRVRGGLGSYLMIAALFGLLNVFVGKLLFVFIGVGTLGIGFVFAFLTRLVVDALMLKVTDALSDRLDIQSFGSAFFAALVMSGVGVGAEWLLHHFRVV